MDFEYVNICLIFDKLYTKCTDLYYAAYMPIVVIKTG